MRHPGHVAPCGVPLATIRNGAVLSTSQRRSLPTPAAFSAFGTRLAPRSIGATLSRRLEKEQPLTFVFLLGALVVLALIVAIWWIAAKATEKATEGKPTDPQE